MNCGSAFVTYFSSFFTGKHHCRHCRRLLCKECCASELPKNMFPEFVQQVYPNSNAPLKVCTVCEKVLLDRANQNGINTVGALVEEEDRLRWSAVDKKG